MIMHRKGEIGAVPFRSGRFFNIDTEWYFACREGKNLGPFGDREKATDALKNYLANNTEMNTGSKPATSSRSNH